MGYLDKLVRGGSRHKHLHKHPLVHDLMTTAEFAAGSYGFGYLQNRYREKASMFGIPADLLAGVGLKVVALGTEMISPSGRLGKLAHLVAPHANAFGNAGVGAFFHTLGAGHGAQASGVKRLLISEADVPKAKAALPNATILGVDKETRPRDVLSAQELADMARRPAR
jgi:hypothetical protein